MQAVIGKKLAVEEAAEHLLDEANGSTFNDLSGHR